MAQTGKMSPRRQVTLVQAQWDPDTRNRRRSHDGRKARMGDPAHDDMDVRTILAEEEEEPWEDWGIRRGGDAFDSLGLWDVRAAEGLGHRT